MQEVELSGSYYKMGYIFGNLIREKLILNTPSKNKLEFAFECEAEIRIHAPGLIEELQGLFDASGLNYESLIAMNFAPYYIRGCNIFGIDGAYTKDSNPIFARNMDWFEAELERFHKYVTHPTSGLSSIGFSFGDIGRCGGVNEFGLAIASASIPFYVGKSEPGLIDSIATRWILDQFSTTIDAVNFLEKLPHCEGISYLLADKNGTIARVEAAPEAVATTYLSNGIMIVSNFFQSEEMKHLDSMPSTDRAFRYYNNIKTWFMKHSGNITTNSAKKLCGTHGTGICEHIVEDNLPPGATIWSWIAELGTNIIEVTDGSPCRNEYRPYKL